MVLVVAMIAIAVTFQAQRVAGQDTLEAVRSEIRDQSRNQSELRAEVAEAESPARILEGAESLGMVEPAAVVAVPAPQPRPPDSSAVGSSSPADRG